MKWGTAGCWPGGVTSDIQSNLIVRGIYVEQLNYWLRFIPRASLLVITDDDLRTATNATMQRIFRHAGLPEFDVSKVSQDRVNQRVQQQWPYFERKSGWKIGAKYDKMSPVTRTKLADLYRPFNLQLYKLLGVDFGWE